MATIRNPLEWSADQLKLAESHAGAVGRSLRGADTGRDSELPVVRQVAPSELQEVLRLGFADFAACRSDVVFVCIIYPIMGMVLAQLALDFDMLPLLFPVISGFALVGPAAAVGLYEMSRRREMGLQARWSDAFATMRSPSFGAMLVLALILLGIFFVWLGVAQLIYMLTLGPERPASFSSVLGDVFGTSAGWTMTLVGIAVGFLFAVVVLSISVVSFPLLLDRDVGLRRAIETSLRVVAANPVTMVMWGAIVAGGLVLGSMPLFIGLIFVLPVLGHATWHLYRRAVEAADR